MSRINRIAIRLIAQLEDYYVHKDPRFEREFSLLSLKERKQHYKVAELKKTQQKLEKWFAARQIPIRIVYAESEQMQAIPKSGVITYQYKYLAGNEPPTAWMIIHNLSHALFDKNVNWREPLIGVPDYYNPHLYQKEYSDASSLHPYRQMIQWISHNKFGVHNFPHVKPTTRSFKNKKVSNNEEAFHECFAQWVSSGHVRLQGDDPERVKRAQLELETLFHKTVDDAVAMGTVVQNV